VKIKIGDLVTHQQFIHDIGLVVAISNRWRPTDATTGPWATVHWFGHGEKEGSFLYYLIKVEDKRESEA
jgi:hypothetical protein